MHDLTYDITVNPHINTILQTNDFNVSIPDCAGERSLAKARSHVVELGSGEERKAAD